MMKHNTTYQKLLLQLLFVVALVFFSTSVALAANWYVDSSVSSSGNGQSWATAWKAFSNMTGLASGDIVYISGGPSGSTQTYALSGWNPVSGATYQIGQDASHNGTAYFSGSGTFISSGTNWTISGDAGDGLRHFTIADPSTNVSPWSMALNIGNCSGFILEYVNFGRISGAGSPVRAVSCNSASNIEINNTWTYVTSASDDAWGYIDCNVQSYDSCRILNNFIDVPTTGAIGADGLQSCNSGCTFAGNTVQTHSGGGVNHQDLFQTYAGGGSCNYTKIYNNTFKNSGQYGIYQDCNGASHWRIYNNIFDSIATYDIAITGEWGGEVYNDIVIANNVNVDGGGLFANGGSSSYSSTYVRNHITVNGGGMQLKGGITQSNNVTITAANAPNYFINYSIRDFHLKSTASTLINHGYDMSAYFTTDKNGISRGSAWDIGPYQYSTLMVRPSSPTNLR